MGQSKLQKRDLEYLRQRFHDGKQSVTVTYRRKFDDTYKEATMELIAADDYSDDCQTLFLYVK